MKKMNLIWICILLTVLIINCDDETLQEEMPVITKDIPSLLPYGGVAEIRVTSENPYARFVVQYYLPEADLWASTTHIQRTDLQGHTILLCSLKDVAHFENEETGYKFRVAAYSNSFTLSNWVETTTFGFQSPIEYLTGTDDYIIFSTDEITTDFFSEKAFENCDTCSIDETYPENQSTFIFGPSNLITYNIQFKMKDTAATPDYDGCIVNLTTQGITDYNYYDGTSDLNINSIIVPVNGFSVSECTDSAKNVVLSEPLREMAIGSLTSVGELKELIDINLHEIAENPNYPTILQMIPYSLVQNSLTTALNTMWSAETPRPMLDLNALVNKWHFLN